MASSSSAPAAKPSDAASVFVRNLTKETTREELAACFSQDFVVKHAIVIHERHGGPSKHRMNLIEIVPRSSWNGKSVSCANPHSDKR